jgi:hypothetical protein
VSCKLPDDRIVFGQQNSERLAATASGFVNTTRQVGFLNIPRWSNCRGSDIFGFRTLWLVTRQSKPKPCPSSGSRLTADCSTPAFNRDSAKVESDPSFSSSLFSLRKKLEELGCRFAVREPNAAVVNERTQIPAFVCNTHSHGRALWAVAKRILYEIGIDAPKPRLISDNSPGAIQVEARVQLEPNALFRERRREIPDDLLCAGGEIGRAVRASMQGLWRGKLCCESLNDLADHGLLLA